MFINVNGDFLLNLNKVEYVIATGVDSVKVYTVSKRELIVALSYEEFFQEVKECLGRTKAPQPDLDNRFAQVSEEI